MGAWAAIGALMPSVGALDEGTPGDPGLYGPGSAVWRIARERALLAGGGTALFLQIAHPLVAAGVADHSGFREDPFARLRSTLDAMLRITFGDAAQSRQAAAQVAVVHRRVRGELAAGTGRFPAGSPYRASDPDLAMWVHATLVATALDAFALLVRPLRAGEADAYYREAMRQAGLFGVSRSAMPADHAGFRVYVEEMVRSTLAVGPDARAIAPGILRPPVAFAARPALSAYGLLTAGLLPERVRSLFGLPWDRARAAAFAGTAASVRAVVSILPERARFWPHAAVAERRVARGR